MTGFRRADLVAVGLYLGLALWAQRVILPAPARTLPYQAALEGKPWLTLERSDQQLTVWQIARNARTLLTQPSRLFDAEQCYPSPGALTLGEHMLGNSLLGVVPYALTRSPIGTYNAVVIAVLWLTAVAMYALVRHWTGSAGAAFVAGVLFAFHPTRLGDPGHPYGHDDAWIPLALLFAHRLFAFERWRDAAGLAAVIGLQLLESFYQVLVLTVVGGLYGLVLLVRYRRRLWALAPKLLLVAGTAGAVLLVVYGPYVHTRRTWGVLVTEDLLLTLPEGFAPGGAYFPGWVALGLALPALIHRLVARRHARAGDPRLALLVAALALVMLASFGVWIGGFYVPSPTPWLVQVIPGLGTVRGVARLGTGVSLVVAFLAGYGLWTLLPARPRVAAAMVAVVTVAACAERFHAPLTQQTFGRTAELKAWEARPSAALIDLYWFAGPGAVLDLPFEYNLSGVRRVMSRYVLYSAYHGRPVAACYNSFALPVRDDVEALAARLPDPAAADALYGLGFRTIMFHKDELHGAFIGNAVGQLRLLAGSGRAVLVGKAGSQAAYRLQSPLGVVATFDALEPATDVNEPEVTPPSSPVVFRFHNNASAIYRHPDPIQPVKLSVHWTGAAGDLVGEVSGLLPLALARGESTSRTLDIPVPTAPGRYDVALALADQPDRPLAQHRVQVIPHGDH